MVGAVDSRQDLVKELFQNEYGRTVRLAQYLALEPDRGEEIAQEAFAVLLRRAPGLEHPEVAAAYLYRVVVNLARSSARRQRLALRHRTPDWAPDSEVGDSSGEVAERQVVLAALARLPRRQRECLVLRYYLDLTEADIAAALGVSAGSVKTHSSRGLAGLGRILGERP